MAGDRTQIQASRIFGTFFRLRSATLAPDALLEEAADVAYRWATGCEAESWSDGRLETARGRVIAESASHGGLQVRHVSLTHSDARKAAVQWRTNVDLVLSERGLDAYCLLLRTDPTGADKVPASAITTPRVVRQLADLGGYKGRHRLSAGAEAIAGPAAVEEFVEGLLLDPARDLPVILFSPDPGGRYASSLEEIEKLAWGSQGAAYVYYLKDASDTFLLSQRVSRPLSAWGGAVRTYMPGLSLDADPFGHPLLMQDRVSAWVVEWLRRDLIGRAAAAYALPEQVQDVLRRGRLERERLDLRSRLEAAEGELAVVQLYQEEVERLTKERDELAGALAERDATVQSQREELRRLDQETRRLRYRLHSGGRSEDEELETFTWPVPQTLEEAVLQAEEAFADTLVFTKAALSSASRMNNSDNSPARLWRIFQVMDDVCRRWRTDTLGMPIATAFHEQGFDRALVSDKTKGRHPDAYSFTYKGKRVSVGPHVDLSRGERVYWYDDESARQFVINHIGQHLPDSTT